MKKNGLDNKVKDQRRILLDQLTGLVGDLTVLKELRSNKMSNAMGVLEFSMDCKLSVIGNKLGVVDLSTRELALTILKQIKDYRMQHPRKAQIDLLKTKDSQDFDIDEITTEAAKVLKNVPE